MSTSSPSESGLWPASMSPAVWDYREDLQNVAVLLIEEADGALSDAPDRLDIPRDPVLLQHWLHLIVTTVSRRVGGRIDQSPVDAHLDRVVETGVEPVSPGPLGLGGELLVRSRILDTLVALPHGYRTALLLKDGRGLTVQQTATVMDVTPSAARSLLYRARRRIRAQSSD